MTGKRVTEKHYPGEKAYWNTLRSGLIPCTVLEVIVSTDPLLTHTEVRIQLTADGAPYKKGELQTVPAPFVYPRSKVRKTRYGHYLFANYEWAPTGEQDNG